MNAAHEHCHIIDITIVDKFSKHSIDVTVISKNTHKVFRDFCTPK